VTGAGASVEVRGLTAGTGGRRARAPGPPPIGPDAMRASLEPVVRAIEDDARRAAGAVADAAEEHALDVLADAAAEAAAVLDEARAQGALAAARAAATESAATRAEARSLVLGAHRRAFESLRAQALQELERRRGSVEVRALAARAATTARRRVGGRAVVHTGGPAGLDVVAQDGQRRAVVSAADLVDRQIAAMAGEVQGLWS